MNLGASVRFKFHGCDCLGNNLKTQGLLEVCDPALDGLVASCVKTRPIGCKREEPSSPSPGEYDMAARSVVGLLTEWLAMLDPNQLDPQHF